MLLSLLFFFAYSANRSMQRRSLHPIYREAWKHGVDNHPCSFS